MGTINRLVGMAKQAIDQNSSSQGRSSGSGGSSDWRSIVRSAADAITGEGDPHSRHDTQRADAAQRPQPRQQRAQGTQGAQGAQGAQGSGLSDADRRAISRYDYLVRTAEPDQLEQVHREAFERLTPHQRSQLTATMREELPADERPRTDAPQDLARSATRLGVLDPRKLTRLLSRSGGSGRGAGSLGAGSRGAGSLGAGALGAGAIGAAGGLLGAVAGGAIVTGIGGSLLQDAISSGIDVDSLTEGLQSDLGGLAEGVGGFEDLHALGTDLPGAADGIGSSVSDAGDRASSLGDQISDLGLGDLFGR